MRFVTYGDYVPGLLRDGRIVDLTPVLGELAALPWDRRMPAVLASLDRLRPEIERLSAQSGGVPAGEVLLRSPLPRPRKILCELGDYNEEMPGQRGPTDFFLKSPDSVIGASESIVLPPIETGPIQARGVVALVIGRPCRNVPPAAAAAYLAGFAGFIDVGAPGYGRPNVGTFFGSSFNTFGPLGPCVVTADEIADPAALAVEFRLNGQVRQSYTLAELHYSLAEQIATASSIMSLRPGDLIVSGRFQHDASGLQAADELSLEVSQIGELRVTVSGPPGPARPAA